MLSALVLVEDDVGRRAMKYSTSYSSLVCVDNAILKIFNNNNIGSTIASRLYGSTNAPQNFD
jgi:hypothetical protein